MFHKNIEMKSNLHVHRDIKDASNTTYFFSRMNEPQKSEEWFGDQNSTYMLNTRDVGTQVSSNDVNSVVDPRVDFYKAPIIYGALFGVITSSMIAFFWGFGNYTCDVNAPNGKSNYNSASIESDDTNNDCSALFLEGCLRLIGMFLVMPLGAVVGAYFTGVVVVYASIAGNLIENAPSRFARLGLFDSSESTVNIPSAYSRGAEFNV